MEKEEAHLGIPSQLFELPQVVDLLGAHMVHCNNRLTPMHRTKRHVARLVTINQWIRVYERHVLAGECTSQFRIAAARRRSRDIKFGSDFRCIWAANYLEHADSRNQIPAAAVCKEI